MWTEGKGNYMRWMITAAVVLWLYGFYAIGQSHPPSVAEGRFADGRYQVVNGTPALSKNIMLLDSVTGSTWMMCSNGDEVHGDYQWCEMAMTSNRPTK
jgi:hypothetical protein